MPNCAVSDDPVSRPRDRDKCLNVAYLRLLGTSQQEAAQAAQVSERSVVKWEACSWWPDILDEARQRWLNNATAATRIQLLKLITEGEPKTVRFAAERLLEEFAPPQKRVAISGDGPPVRVDLDVASMTDEELAEAMRGRSSSH